MKILTTILLTEQSANNSSTDNQTSNAFTAAKCSANEEKTIRPPVTTKNVSYVFKNLVTACFGQKNATNR